MVKINPIRIMGKWDVGYSLDVHTVSSTLIGEDPYGNMLFNTKRSDIGELLYQYKYQQKAENKGIIVDTIIGFLDQHPEMNDFDSIIPVPPTPDNQRFHQPTYEISEALANRLNVYFCDNVLEKRSGVQLKGKTAEEKAKLSNFIEKRKRATRRNNVLILDDLYQTGTTLNFCAQSMREDPLVDKIYVLTITKTKNR